MTESADAAAPRNLFTYGSLMFDPVWKAVVPGRYQSHRARLHGYRRYAVRDELYPAVMRSSTSAAEVTGRLYRAVSAADLSRLDAFEGAQYGRVGCEVKLLDGGEHIVADVYLFLRPELLLAQDWDADAFERDGMHDFIKKYRPTI